MQGVNIKQTRLFMQAINENDFGYLTLKEHEMLDWVLEQAKTSELYNSVGKDIEDMANKIVKEECEPEWKRISEAMHPLGDKANELEKEKAAAPTSDQWPEEKEKELTDLNKQIANLADEYQKVTDAANAKLNEYKENRISEEQWACFLVEDDVYDIVDSKIGWRVYEKPLDK